MKNLKLYLSILGAAVAVGVFALLNVNYKRAEVIPPQMPEIPKLELAEAKLESSLPKGETIDGLGLDNVMRDYRTNPPDPNEKNRIPAPPTISDMVVLQGIAMIGTTTRGAIIELKGAAAPKTIAANTRAANTRGPTRPGTTQAAPIERVSAPKTSAEGHMVRSRYYKVGDKFDLPKGIAVFERIVSDSAICVSYLDSEYILYREYNYIVLNEAMSKFKEEARKKSLVAPKPPGEGATREDWMRYREEMQKYNEAMGVTPQPGGGPGGGFGPGGGPGGNANAAGMGRGNRGTPSGNTTEVRTFNRGGGTPGGNTQNSGWGGGSRGGRGR